MLKALDELFHLHRAKSGLFDNYSPGDFPYVGNGFADNGVAGFVKPRRSDRTFNFPAICLSSFCEATVQTPPFVACGRAGNGTVVLEPRVKMPIRQLAYIAAYINLAVRWRFNWYRQTTATRLRKLKVPELVPPDIRFDLKSALPKVERPRRKPWELNLRLFPLGDLYQIQPGDFHSMSALPSGSVPIVSCGDADNGVSGYRAVPDGMTYINRLTIAFNGMNTLTAKFHPYEFATKDDVAVCIPKTPLRLTTELFIQMMMNRERWRYSYYRKCFADKLRRFSVALPAKGEKIDEDVMQAVVESSPYFRFLKGLVKTNSGGKSPPADRHAAADRGNPSSKQTERAADKPRQRRNSRRSEPS